MATTQTPEGQKILVKEMSWDPITRIVGSLGIHTEIDFTNQSVLKCYSTSMVFRGFDIFMKGIDPRDAHFITSRICGICGDNHCTCSCLNQNMAYGVKPPKLGDYAYNLAESADFMFDHAIFNDCMANVDFCEQMVKETNPTLLKTAESTPSPHGDIHGYKTIADIMRALNPFTGSFYLETLQVARYTREMYCLFGGRHTHPSTIMPGGVSADITHQTCTDYYVRLMRYIEYVKRTVPMHDDLYDFFLQQLPGYDMVGYRDTDLGLLGLLRRSRLRRLQLQGHDRVGAAPLHHAGPRVQGRADHDGPRRDQPRDAHPARQLVLRRLVLRGDVRRRRTRSATRSTSATRGTRRRCRSRRSATSPTSTAGSRRRACTTSATTPTSPVTPAAGRSRASGSPPRPASSTSATSRPRATASRWCFRRRRRCPRWSSSGTSPRSRTRSSGTARAPTTRPTPRSSACTASRRRSPRSAPAARRAGASFKVPDEAVSVGFHEAARGVLSHHMVIKEGKIANYQPYPPTPWNANPRDVYGTPGPYEDAVQNTPIFEENGPGELQGHRHHARRPLVRPVPAVRRAHVHRRGQGAQGRPSRRPASAEAGRDGDRGAQRAPRPRARSCSSASSS